MGRFNRLNSINKNFFENSYASKIAERLGYKLNENLGRGSSGISYTMNGGKVLKITSDKAEFLVANKLKGKTLKRIANIFETYKVKEQEAFIIVLEYINLLPNELFQLIEEYNESNTNKRDSPKFYCLKKQLNEIERELKDNGMRDPYDFDWRMNMGIKNGSLAAFDICDNTVDCIDYSELDISNIEL